ncbi:unnamed protein product [Cyprideis torosa]|uniref:Uncharacterized protein n=1 Tax=Cyprideis torosa TaxID=163714 RepID=A0A7R8WJH6_9CRUS|nr:unnamed protein product [Cyprideis torosa]CAG0895738.1 unnamed protein product [Cyprideis torosa]
MTMARNSTAGQHRAFYFSSKVTDDEGNSRPTSSNSQEKLVEVDSNETHSFAYSCFASFYRFLWIVVVITCTFVLLLQVTICVNKLRHPGITTQTQVMFNNSLDFPAVTVCQRQGFKLSQLKAYNVDNGWSYKIRGNNVFNSFDFQTHSLEKFWTDATYAVDDIIWDCSLGQDKRIPCPTEVTGGETKAPNLGVSHHLSKQYGRCCTIFQLPDLESPPELGQEKGLMVILETNTSEYKDQDQEYSGWSVFVHPVQEKWTEFSQLGDTILETIQINLGEEVTLRLAVSEYKTVNNPPKDTCMEDETFSVIECRERCFYEYLETRVPCRGPWVQNSSLEICSNATDMKKFLSEENRVLGTISDRCDCTRQCKFRRYSMAAMDRKDSLAPFKGLQRGKIELYYPNGLAHRVTESWGYDASQFIGEVGGSLGLLLGMSVLSFLEILENISRVMWAKFCGKKKRDPTQVVT